VSISEIQESITLQGHEELILDDQSFVPRLESGRVSVYLVRIVNGQPSGQHHYLTMCRPGDVMLARPIKVNDEEYALVISAIETSEVVNIGASNESWHDKSTITGCLAWASRLCKALGEGVTASYTEKPQPDGRIHLSSGQHFRIDGNTTKLVGLNAGELYLFGDGHLAVSPGVQIPVTTAVWFRAFDSVEGRVTESTTENSAALIDGTVELSRLFILRSVAVQLDANQRELQRLEELSELEASQRRGALDHLSVDKDERKQPLSNRNPLLAALELVGRETGSKLRPTSRIPEGLPSHQVVPFLARAAGTRVRKVRLAGAWWKQDGGCLLAFRESDHAPVVLVTRRSFWGLARHYEMVDVQTGSAGRVTAENEETLERDAWEFVCPLPVSVNNLSIVQLNEFSFKPFLPDMLTMFGLSLISGIFGLLMPVANRLMMDDVIPNANRDLLVDLSIGLTAMSISLFLFSLAQGIISLRVKTAMTARLQSSVIDRLLKLPNRFFRKYSSGDLLNRSMMISEISTGFSNTLLNALFSAISTIMLLVVCFHYAKPLAWIALFSAIITTLVTVPFSFMIRKRALKLEIESGDLYGFIVQMIAGVAKLQTAGAENRAFHQWAKRYGSQLNLGNKVQLLSHWSSLINMLIQSLSTAAVYYLAGEMVRTSKEMQAISPLVPPVLTIGMFFAFQGAFTSVVGGVSSFFQTFIQVHQLLAKRDLVRPILEEPLDGGTERGDPGRLNGRLSANNIVFRYHEDGPLILNSVSVDAHPGEFIAFCGPSGSGKSTLLKLMLGFEAPESGQVLFDGRDLAGLDMSAVRRQIGVVLQHGRLNAGPIFELISGANNLTLEEAWEAAEDAGFAEDIRQMPMQMHTMLPEGATTLSGGQRQRLLIARALATNPSILVFDEATSALDNRTQEIVSKSLARRQVTRVVVAHRLSTIRDADQIYVLDQGEVIESGSYDELFEQKGLFWELASRQIV
jgi:NHLM bacteriocin system ABC transporter ATP-binding protein